MTAALSRGLVALVGELVGAGVRDAIVCPGSRSTPMALALAANPSMRVRVLLDERSASFAALGMARVARRPVAVLVTSGTAAAELLPAAVEADLARVPLLLLTADRPAELRDRGAAQTIDQAGLFGTHVRWAAEVPLMDGAPETLAHWRWLACRAVSEALGTGRGAGPVHLNLAYREPLVPEGALAPGPDRAGAPFVSVVEGERLLDPLELDRLAARLAETDRGLIVAGPDDAPVLPLAARTLSTATGYPIVADVLSGVPRGHGVRGDLLLRPGPWRDAHRPDLVIRVGAIPTSRWTNELVDDPAHELWVLDGAARWPQPAPRAATIIHAHPAATLMALAERVRRDRDRPPSAWSSDWSRADRAVQAAATAWLGALDEPFEGQPFHALGELDTDRVLLWVGSSMPVRDLDTWFDGSERMTVIASRGANGIDGVTSAAAGAATVHRGPVLLVTGDISFVHDLGGLVTARLLEVPLTVVVIDNDGGGIFSFLAQATTERPEAGLPARFEALFGTPHGTDLAASALALGAVARQVDHRSLSAELGTALADRSPGVRVLRLATDRRRNVELHALVARVAADTLASLR